MSERPLEDEAEVARQQYLLSSLLSSTNSSSGDNKGIESSSLKELNGNGFESEGKNQKSNKKGRSSKERRREKEKGKPVDQKFEDDVDDVVEENGNMYEMSDISSNSKKENGNHFQNVYERESSNYSVGDSERLSVSTTRSFISQDSISQDDSHINGNKKDKKHLLSVAERYKQYLWLSYVEHKRNKCQYFLGCCSIFVVVIIVALSLTILSYSPVLFLGLAESQGSETDFIIYSSAFEDMYFINYTEVDYIMNSQPSDLSYHSSRNNFFANTYLAHKCEGWNKNDPFNSEWSYDTSKEITSAACYQEFGTCVNYQCPNGIPATIVTLDSLREKRMEFGRSWKLPPVPEKKCYIESRLANQLDVNVGDVLVVSFAWNQVFGYFSQVTFEKFGMNSENSTEAEAVFLHLEVAEIITSSYGKWPSASKNVIVVEYDWILKAIAENIHPSYRQDFRDYFSSLNPRDAVRSIYFNVPPPRFKSYPYSNYRKNAKGIISWASRITDKIGFNQIDSSVPILSSLQSNSFASSFLGLMLNIIILLLSGISILLIYSLLMISVESRTFELAVFRMLGLERIGLVQMLIVYALTIAIPAWSIALIAAQIGFIFVAQLFESISDVKVSPFLTSDSLIAATFIGLAIPLISSILPIKAALSKNLRESLDTSRSKTKAVMITVERASVHQDLGTTLFIGLLLTIYGVTFNYLLPLGLITRSATLLFNIFLAIMMGMLAGMVMIALNIQPILEYILLKILFIVIFFENRSLHNIVSKNLQAHRQRNKKTSIAYATSLGFILFLSVAFSIELRTLQYQEYRYQGSDLRVMIWEKNENGSVVGIDPPDVLENWASQHPLIEDFAWIGHHLKDLHPKFRTTQITNMGRYIKNSMNLFPASPNILEVVEKLFVRESKYDTSSPFSFSEQLYTIEGEKGVLMGQYFVDRLHLDLGTDFLTELIEDTRPIATTYREVMHPIAFFDNTPIFDITYFVDNRQDLVLSFPDALDMTYGKYKSLLDLPLRYFIIQIKEGLTDEQKDQLVRDIPRLKKGDVDDIRDQFNGLVRQKATITWIFQIVTLFTMLVSFFSLNTSMYTNIMEQTKELGVLRALGLGRFHVYRVYTYEAFVLVLSSSILGILIGTPIGWSISAQRALFTEVPLSFVFPWDLCITVILIAVTCAILSTTLPVLRLMRLTPVSIFRIN